jgi:G3E family GTPase
MIRFPQLGHTTRMQIEDADTVLLNKVDLASPPDLSRVEEQIRRLNPTAPVLPTRLCRVDPDLLFGIAREREIRRPEHIHQPEFESFSYRTSVPLQKQSFEEFAGRLPENVYRAKGFVRFPEGTHLFNFVAGRWELEPFPEETTALVFIGKGIKPLAPMILGALKDCEA